jgi:hypothetical protein
MDELARHPRFRRFIPLDRYPDARTAHTPSPATPVVVPRWFTRLNCLCRQFDEFSEVWSFVECR